MRNPEALDSTTSVTNPTILTAPLNAQQTLRECVQQAMEKYLSQLGDFPARNIYDMVVSEVEIPLLETIMVHTRGNQSKAAILLGISRGTLRKKLKQYNLEEVR